jgi:hypothetical protein
MNVQILRDYVIAGDVAKAIGPITRHGLRTGRAGTNRPEVQARTAVWGSRLAGVGARGGAGMSKLVVVRFSDLAVHKDFARRKDFASGAMRWEAAGSGGALFPVLDTDIMPAKTGDDAAILAAWDVHRPPLGVLGA